MDEYTSFELRDGRRLDLRVSGPSDGGVVLFHHGTPGSSLPTQGLASAAHRRGLRLVTTSRPGYGTSTRLPDRQVVDVVDDLDQVLRSLGVDRCLVAGWSGGGPHALACAARLTATTAVLVIASVAPCGVNDLDWLGGMGEENVVEFSRAFEGEDPLRSYLGDVGDQLRSITADGLVSAVKSVLPPVDQIALAGPLGDDIAASFRDGLANGVDGWIDDDLAFTKPWGFTLGEITAPVALWQGSEDLMVPLAHGQWLATRLPGATVHFEPGEGHLSIGLRAIEAMLDELIDQAER